MKNSLKLSVLAIIIAISFSSCGDGSKPSTPVDTGKIDTTKKDATMVKGDTTNVDTITKKK
jgi:hypothetical protein